MKKFRYSLNAAFVAAVISVVTPTAALLSGCSQAETSAENKGPAGKRGVLVNVDKKGVILNGYDVVAYFKQGRAVKGNPNYSSRYGSATYYFASEEDKARFEKAPAKYAPQYGGFCANSMRKRKLADVDPNQFYIYKGKLYVCSSSSALKEFSSRPDVNIPAADKNWQFYQPPNNPALRRYLGG
ncbi:MAG: YHS domain-containing protein [Verrucomicrobia bacterium]|nr:YHS domain-containing protein [Verrucomicrobiota bacterium]